MEVISGWGSTHDLDGIYSYEHFYEKPSSGYSAILRTGCVEVVQCFGASHKFIPNPALEGGLMQAFGKAVKWLPMTEMGPPVSVMVSLLDVGGRALHFGPSHPILGIRRISKSDLIMHDVFIEKLEMTPAEVLRPICDAIWQASGLERSFNFDEAGKWRPQPWD